LAKYGAGQSNFSCKSLSALVWGGTLSKNLFGNFIIIFLLGIATGQDQQQSPVLRQCRTLAAIIGQFSNYAVHLPV